MNKEIMNIPHDAGGYTEVSPDVYGTPEADSELVVKVGGADYTAIAFGDDNQLPYHINELVEKNSVMSQNKLFNLLTCYGRGLEYMDAATMSEKEPKPTKDADIRMWLIRNNIKRFFAEQITDMKYYFFTVTVFILNRNRDRIVKVVHKDACHCRFTKAGDDGRIRYVLFANWKNDNAPENVEVIPLLDEHDPLGDLLARTGKERDELGYFKPDSRSNTKYAMLCRMPTVGCQYYPVPTYTAVFRDGWYDIYGLLTAAKKAKIKNGQNIRYHIEIATQFWEDRARAYGLQIGSKEFKKMKDDFINDLRDYFSGSENSDKLMWSEFETLMDGKERHSIKVNVVDTSKAGNEYNDDVSEAANVLCYDDNTHPNLAGATPGKSQMNNSGSDKRELFTMKQALETLPHDMMMMVHYTIIYFNGWQDKVVPVVPMIMLTTLDKNTDAKEVNTENTNIGNGNNQ